MTVRTLWEVRHQDRNMATTEHGMPVVREAEDWKSAGEAWGSRANDWSCLYEHYSIDVLIALFARLGVETGTKLLDIACGSGLGVRIADAMGAAVSGIDAAEELI